LCAEHSSGHPASPLRQPAWPPPGPDSGKVSQANGGAYVRAHRSNGCAPV